MQCTVCGLPLTEESANWLIIKGCRQPYCLDCHNRNEHLDDILLVVDHQLASEKL